MSWGEEGRIEGLGREEKRREWKAYFEGQDPENVFDAEASATCLVKYNSDSAIDAMTA